MLTLKDHQEHGGGCTEAGAGCGQPEGELRAESQTSGPWLAELQTRYFLAIGAWENWNLSPELGDFS